MPYDNLTFLISSCDKYAACWPAFCYGLTKYWPEHPQNLVFITNQLSAPCGESLTLGEDRGWAYNLLTALERIKTDFILYAQEDYWIKQPVPDQDIQDYVGYLASGKADYIRLYPAPGPDQPWEFDERLGMIGPDAEYRASLQMALWRKDELAALLQPGESPWQFEVHGTQRSREAVGRYLCVNKRRYGIDYVFTAIVNGYWTEKAFQYAHAEGLTIPFDQLTEKPMIRKIIDRIRSAAYKTRRKIL